MKCIQAISKIQTSTWIFVLRKIQNSSLYTACSSMFEMAKYGMPLILFLFENESPHGYFTEFWDVF